MKEIPINNMMGINEKYLNIRYPIFYDNIFKIKCDSGITLSERVWLYKNELTESPICPNCHNKKLTFRNLTIGYRKFCSKKCSAEYSHKDPDIKQKRISRKQKRQRKLFCQFT